MKIENKLPSKNFNVSSESDSALFIRYIWFFVFLILCLYLFFLSLWLILTQFISIEDEKKIFPDFWKAFSTRALPDAFIERYKDIEYSIEVIDFQESENAFAALWWRMYITENLLEEITYIEELDFIIGHELAHIENRDVLKTLTASIPMNIILSIFWGDYGSQIFSGLVSNNYSKLSESRADRYALDFTHSLNWHIWCSLDFFEKNNTLSSNVSGIFSSHPVTALRISRAEKYAEKMWYKLWKCTVIDL